MSYRRISIILIFALLLISCKSISEEKNQFKTKDKAPESLGKVSENLGKVLYTIGEIEKINMNLEPDNQLYSELKKEDNKIKENSDTNKEDNIEGNKVEDTENTENSNELDKRKKEIDKSDKIRELWIRVDKNLNEIHSNWNQYEVDLLSKAILDERNDSFESALNKMTAAVEDKTIIDIYDYGSQAILNLKPFFDLYKDEIRGDICVIKYSIFRAYLIGISGDKEEAAKVLKNKEEYIMRIKLKVEDNEDTIEEVDKIHKGIKAMDKALEEYSKRLLIIKKDIIIESIKSIE